jgi:hypothetical protein
MSKLANKIRELLHQELDMAAMSQFIIDNAPKLIDELEAAEKCATFLRRKLRCKPLSPMRRKRTRRGRKGRDHEQAVTGH